MRYTPESEILNPRPLAQFNSVTTNTGDNDCNGNNTSESNTSSNYKDNSNNHAASRVNSMWQPRYRYMANDPAIR